MTEIFKMRIFWNLVIGLLFCFLQFTAAYYQGNGDVQNEYVRTGSNATLYCQPATDVDNINRIIWYKEDKKIAEVVNGRRTFWDAGTHVNLQTHNNALYFRRVTYPDSGEYYCEINGKRTRNSLARLLVQGKKFALLETQDAVTTIKMQEEESDVNKRVHRIRSQR